MSGKPSKSSHSAVPGEALLVVHLAENPPEEPGHVWGVTVPGDEVPASMLGWVGLSAWVRHRTQVDPAA